MSENSGLPPRRGWAMYPVVKWILLLFPLFLTGPAAAANDPGAAALEFLGKIREKKIDLSAGKDTAISKETTDGKHKEIAGMCERLALDLANGELELGEIRQDGDIAGVVVKKIGGFDPGNMQVFAVGVVKHGDTWLPAPVIASFENTGLGRDTGWLKRLNDLEMWMLRQQVLELQMIRQEAGVRMRKRIEASLPLERLAAMDARQTMLEFIDRCGRQDLPGMLGLLGGLNENRPEDWAARMKAVSKAVAAGKEAPVPWRQVMAPEVFRILLDADVTAGEGVFTLACLDPQENTAGFKTLYLEVVKSSEGLPQIDLPAAFYEPENHPAGDEELDEDTVQLLAAGLAKTFPPAPAGTAEKAVNDLMTALRQESLSRIFPLVSPSPAPDETVRSITRAAQTWSAMHDPATVMHPLQLGFHEEGSQAVAVVQFFSTRDPERTDLRIFHFTKTAGGWLWTPFPPAVAEYGSDLAKIHEWLAKEQLPLSKSWQARLLAKSRELKNVPAGQAPAPDTAKQVTLGWLAAVREGDVEKALSLTAWIGDGRGASRMLRNLGYEMAAAKKQAIPPEIVDAYHSPDWTVVGVKTSAEGEVTGFPLYPIVSTPGGPRILLEIDLFATQARGREFLNKASIERLLTIATPALVEDLRKLLETYKAAVLK